MLSFLFTAIVVVCCSVMFTAVTTAAPPPSAVHNATCRQAPEQVSQKGREGAVNSLWGSMFSVLNMDQLKHTDDHKFMMVMMEYLQAKGASAHFINKIIMNYVQQPIRLREIFSKLMTSDEESNESFEQEFKAFLQRVPHWNFVANDANRAIFWNDPTISPIPNS